MTIDLAAAQARAEQAMALADKAAPGGKWVDLVRFIDEARTFVPDLARLVLDLVARVQDAELALAVYDEAVVSEYWERWPPAESPAP